MSERLQRVQFGLGIAMVAGLAFLFGVEGNSEETLSQGRSAVGWMIGRWNWAGTDMSHGWVIPLVSLYTVWVKRRELQAAPKALAWSGLWIVILAVLLYLAGLRVQQTRLVLLSLLGLLWGIPYFLWGRTVAGLLLFPCGYLVFCIPITFIDELTLPLRLTSTAFSVGLLNGLGIAVTRLGTAIHVATGSGFSLDVGIPCSGLRYLLAMVALTTAYAYFTQKSFLKRAILCVSAIPLAMAGNIVRIVLIALVGTWFGTDFALGFYHDYSGYVVFAVATVLMIWEGGLLHRLTRFGPHRAEPVTGSAGEPRQERRRASLLAGMTVVVSLLALTAGLVITRQGVTVATASTADMLANLPGRAGEWQGFDVFYCQNEQCLRSFEADKLGERRTCPVCDGPLDKMALGERNLLPSDTVLDRKLYRNPRGDQITVTIVLSGTQQRSIHRPQQCLPAQGLAIEQSRVIAVPLEGGKRLQLALLRARPERAAPGSPAPRALMAYWFAGGGHETSSHFERLGWMAWDNLAHGIRSRWAYVSLQMSETGSAAASEQRIVDVTRALYPLIRRPASPQPQ